MRQGALRSPLSAHTLTTPNTLFFRHRYEAECAVAKARLAAEAAEAERLKVEAAALEAALAGGGQLRRREDTHARVTRSREGCGFITLRWLLAEPYPGDARPLAALLVAARRDEARAAAAALWGSLGPSKGLADMRAAGISARELRDGGIGCGPRELRGAGCTCAELRDAGFSASELRHEALFDVTELAGAGFELDHLRSAGFSAQQLRLSLRSAPLLLWNAGYSVAELRDAGFQARHLAFQPPASGSRPSGPSALPPCSPSLSESCPEPLTEGRHPAHTCLSRAAPPACRGLPRLGFAHHA